MAYESDDNVADRYTIFFRTPGAAGRYGSGVGDCWVRGMSDNAMQPNGFNQYVGECLELPYDVFSTEAEETLGKETDFDELPKQVQRAITFQCEEFG
jgi:hypothetical protein